MLNYLTTWESMLPKVQSDWINSYLQQGQDLYGWSTDEVKQQLQLLIRQMAAGPTRTLSQYYAPNSRRLIDPEVYNTMLNSITADLQAAFAEALNLGQLLQVYQEIYNHRIIEALRVSLNQIDVDLQRLWYMRGNSLGFSDAQICTFSQTAAATPRSDPLASTLYVDPRTNQIIPETLAATIDAGARALTLPVNLQKTIAFTDVSLDTEAVENVLMEREVAGSSLSNLIDQQAGTYWIAEVITTQPSAVGLDLTLKLDPGGYRDFSFLEIQPVSDFPVWIKGLSYETDGGQRSSLLQVDQESVLQNPISQPVRLQFPVKRGRYLYVRLAQDSYIPITSSSLSQNSSVSQLMDNPNQVSSLPQLRINDQECCQYTLGLDNILAGSIKYLNTGIFVGAVQRVSTCGLIALDAQAQDLTRQGAVEYAIFKRDYDGNGNILRSQTFPILPLEQTIVEQEALILTQSISSPINNVGNLRFRAAGAIQVYEEERVLSGTAFQASPDPSGITTQVQIVRAGSQFYYTADYQPLHLTTTSPLYLNNNQDLWLGGSNAVHCATSLGGISIAASDLALIIILRGNPNNLPATPRVMGYKLLTGAVNQEKFYESL